MAEVVFLGINDIGKRIYDWLTERDDADVRALLTEPNQLSLVKQLRPDLLISAGFRHIVPEDVLAATERGGINFHKSYLPYNRGANPNVWSIVEDTPAGVSLHYMTPDVDQGPIVDRREVPQYPEDNGRSLYERLEDAQFDQFRECWPSIRDGTAEVTVQEPGTGTYHYKEDFVDLWEIDRDETVRAGDLLDRLRALTFPPYKNAYFEADGRRYCVEVSITPEDGESETGEHATAKRIPRYSTDEAN